MPKTTAAKCYWIYILECNNGSYYTGYTINIARRYRQHVEGKAGVRYTRSHRPVRIAQCWRLFGDVGTALKVESLIKRRNRPTKDRLVENPKSLGPLASDNLSRRVRIYTTDPTAVETESMAMTPEDLKNGFDPFAGAPAADM
jgi:putative endonuclease